MAHKQPCAKYQYVVTAAGPKILPVEEPSCKDEESPADYNAGGYLPIKVNDTFQNGRYRVVRKLGWGHFSTVWLVKDTQTRRHSALKVVKSAGRYAETARDEIKLLSRVSSFSPTHPGRSYIVSFLDSFFYQGPEASHVCIVFEPLGENLLAMIERNKKKGVPRALVKVITKQILLGLQYLHDECDLVHTDIKPENILISIPDIEAHIQNELSQSLSPTSRRVGVPLPTMSRAGVSIPHSRHRAHRQVQIFDSQPLASPGRSAGQTGNGHVGMSMSRNTRHGNNESGSNSINGSYVGQTHISRLTTSNSNSVTGAAKGVCSSAPKFPSGLSAFTPHPDHAPPRKYDSRLLPNKGIPAIMSINPISPSTSSSSSSMSSTLASTAAGSSSIISTPPTSLPHSLGNAVAGFMALTKLGDQLMTGAGVLSDDGGIGECERGIPVSGRKGKEKMSIEDELRDASSTSWKDHLGVPGSWKDKVSARMSSSYISTSSSLRKSKLSQVENSGHSRVHPGIPVSAHWKDPGTAAPAPAVVVSAIVGSDGEKNVGSYLNFAGASTDSAPGVASTTASGCSSATATITRLSRNGTPSRTQQTVTAKPSSVSNSIENINTKASSSLIVDTALAGPEICANSQTTDPTPNPLNSNPSLLTQTAPLKASFAAPSASLTSSTKCTTLRPSPPHHISQLSAHMHSRPSISYISPGPSHSHHIIKTSSQNAKSSNSPTNAQNLPTVTTPLSPTSLTPTPTSPPPAVPPSTPVASPPISPLAPAATFTSSPPSRPSTPPIHLHYSANPGFSDAPPISIKIADLGNATPSTKHYTDDIQTRQYRAPEAILGRRDWDARADVWSVACVVFELLTAEFLFDPHGQGELFNKDDDHMAQIIELLGDFSLDIKMGGRYSRELFDHTGTLRYIRTLKPWPLKRVMTEKYLFSDDDAEALSSFLFPMLTIDMRKRTHARDMINHPWLTPVEGDEEIGEW